MDHVTVLLAVGLLLLVAPPASAQEPTESSPSGSSGSARDSNETNATAAPTNTTTTTPNDPLQGQPGSNDSPFALIELDAYPEASPTPRETVARITIKEPYLSTAYKIFLQVGDHSPHLRIELGDPVTPKGTPVEISDDGRANIDPSIIVSVDEIQDANGTFELPMFLSADARGRFHFGLLALAFDEDWDLMTYPDGSHAQSFAYAAASAPDLRGAGLGRPFVGDGNEIPAPGWIVVAAVLAVAAHARRRP